MKKRRQASVSCAALGGSLCDVAGNGGRKAGDGAGSICILRPHRPEAGNSHAERTFLQGRRRTGKGNRGNAGKKNRSLGEAIREVILPETLKKIGRYAFYNYRKLKQLALGGACMDVGAGAFTGCHQVEEIRITVLPDGSSALQEILTELPETIPGWTGKRKTYRAFSGSRNF